MRIPDNDDSFYLRAIVKELLRGAEVSVMQADTYIRLPEFNTSKVLDIIGFIDGIDDLVETATLEEHDYARGLLLKLGDFMRSTCQDVLSHSERISNQGGRRGLGGMV